MEQREVGEGVEQLGRERRNGQGPRDSKPAKEPPTVRRHVQLLRGHPSRRNHIRYILSIALCISRLCMHIEKPIRLPV